jgi:uncharacterized protein (TIGR02246 family)
VTIAPGQEDRVPEREDDARTLHDRIAALERRVHALEDELAVTRLVTRYGPAADTGDADGAAALWTESGVYDAEGPGRLVGRSAIAGMLRGEAHQAMVPGCAHVNGPSVVRLAGDEAVVVGYSRVYRTDADGPRLMRLAANRWELVRTSDGWRAERRVNRRLGSPESLTVLRGALDA